MLSVVAGAKHTKIQMMIYTSLLIPLTLAPYILGYAGALYGIAATVLGAIFILSNVKVLLHDDLKHAKIMFGYSVFYLFALFLGLMIDAGI